MISRLTYLSRSMAKLGLHSESKAILKLADSQGNIVSLLGYPKEVADWFQHKFGKYSFLMAKWAKELYSHGRGDFLENITPFGLRGGEDYPKLVFRQFSVKDLLKYRDLIFKLHQMQNMDEIKNLLIADGRRLGLEWDNESDNFINGAINEVFEFLSGDLTPKIEPFFEWFMHQDIVKAVLLGTINLNEYKKLSLNEAVEKFNAKNLDPSEGFPTVLNLEDGWRWIAVGPKCQWVGKEMKNCGSSGIYSEYGQKGGEFQDLTKDRTILVLVDPGNSPHLMLVYSQEANWINAVEGKGSGHYPKIEYLKRLKPLYMALGKPNFGKSSIGVIEKYLNDEIELVKDLDHNKMYFGYYLGRDQSGNLFVVDSSGRFGGIALPEEALEWDERKLSDYQREKQEEVRQKTREEEIRTRGY